jgi:nickel transport protein
MRGLFLCLLLLAMPAAAHEVIVESGGATATVISLHYADGQPFAFEAYELYPAGNETPAQVGRTDARGRVVFIAGETAEWRLKAWSADGHGVERSIPAVAGEITLAASPPARSSLWLAGLGGIFGLFGLWQLYARKKS